MSSVLESSKHPDVWWTWVRILDLKRKKQHLCLSVFENDVLSEALCFDAQTWAHTKLTIWMNRWEKMYQGLCRIPDFKKNLLVLVKTLLLVCSYRSICTVLCLSNTKSICLSILQEHRGNRNWKHTTEDVRTSQILDSYVSTVLCSILCC